MPLKRRKIDGNLTRILAGGRTGRAAGGGGFMKALVTLGPDRSTLPRFSGHRVASTLQARWGSNRIEANVSQHKSRVPLSIPRLLSSGAPDNPSQKQGTYASHAGNPKHTD